MQNPIIKKSFLFIFGTKKPSATKESKKFSKIDNATPPKTPSHVFAGLIVFQNYRFPKALPKSKHPVSLMNDVKSHKKVIEGLTFYTMIINFTGYVKRINNRISNPMYST